MNDDLLNHPSSIDTDKLGDLCNTQKYIDRVKLIMFGDTDGRKRKKNKKKKVFK